MAQTTEYTNRLINETSPYLLQHAHNPVDWYPWGAEALERARNEDKPIFLSVGYSACHWCHVMAHESFEDVETAELLNANFINIKVDREERPDIDSIYMAAVQAMTRSGGWPMTVFITPDGAPFYGGTYFPLEPRYGMPSFKQVINGVIDAYTERRAEVQTAASTMAGHLRDMTLIEIPQAPINPRLLHHAAQQQMQQFDPRFGGYGNAPKFPQAMMLEMILRHWHRSGDATALNQIELTLRRMANGGIYDQLGGGFARYSVDAYWLVPHFEKMLYDNALLARLYLETYQATGDDFFKRIAVETLAYIERDMTDAEGGFYAAEDADSEGEEGKFYVWKPSEIKQILNPDDAELAMRFWDVTERGNFEGHSILNVPRDPAVVANEFGMTLEEFNQRIANIRQTLLAERSKRIRPGLDDKILAAWNGMMLRTYAFASRVINQNIEHRTQNIDYRQIAERNATFLTTKMIVNGRLHRSYKAGQAKFNGYLEDYANVADGLLELYQATFNLHWLSQAISLVDTMLELFWDDEQRTFFDTASDHEQLVTRPRDVYDNATPSGTSVAVDVLLRLANLLERPEYAQYAQTVLDQLSGAMAQIPGAFGRLFAAVDFMVNDAREIAIIGDPSNDDTQALIREIYTPYLPNKVIACAMPDDQTAINAIPLLAERPMRDGKATAYVCVRRACQQPTNDPQELAEQLRN